VTIKEGFVSLWPTVFLQRVLRDSEATNSDLIRLIRRLEEEQEALTTEYRDVDFFARDEDCVSWLGGEIGHSVEQYFKWRGMDYGVEWSLQGWANVNRFGDYHDYHNHPRSYLSGTYYVKIPEEMERLKTRADLRPGCITFYDPRYGANMTAIKGDPYIDPEYTIRPQPGLLLLWPSFINHFVHPNLSKQTRVTVSFNVMLKWKDDYLPTQ